MLQISGISLFLMLQTIIECLLRKTRTLAMQVRVFFYIVTEKKQMYFVFQFNVCVSFFKLILKKYLQVCQFRNAH